MPTNHNRRYVTDSLFVEANGTTPETLGAAVAFLEELRPLGGGEQPDTLDAVQCALDDPATDAVLLITDGARSATARLASQRVAVSSKRVSTVALGVSDGATIEFLRGLARGSGGAFHVYTGPMDNIAEDTGVERSRCDSVPLKRLRNEVRALTRY